MECPLNQGWDPIVPGWSWLYSIRPPPIKDWPIGGVGDFHTVRGGINPGNIHVRSRVVGVKYV